MKQNTKASGYHNAYSRVTTSSAFSKSVNFAAELFLSVNEVLIVQFYPRLIKNWKLQYFPGNKYTVQK